MTTKARNLANLLANGSIDAAELSDSSVTTAKISDDAVTNDKISITELGIGTDSPEALLHLSGDNPEIRFSDTTNGNYSAIQNLDGNMIYKADAGNQFGFSRHRFEIDGTEAMRIDSSGDVGIGTNSPAAALHVNGGGTWIRHTGTDGYVDIGNWYTGEGRVESDLPLKIRTGNVDSPITFTPGGIDIMSIDADFRVAMSNMLNVGSHTHVGQTSSGAMSIFGHNVEINKDVNNQILAKNTGYYAQFIKMYYGEGITFHAKDTTVTAGDVVYDAAGSWNELMRLSNSGNLGIGNINPDTYVGSYTSLVIGTNELGKAGLIKLSSTYNSGNGAEIYQDTIGKLGINTNSSNRIITIEPTGQVDIGNDTGSGLGDDIELRVKSTSTTMKIGGDNISLRRNSGHPGTTYPYIEWRNDTSRAAYFGWGSYNEYLEMNLEGVDEFKTLNGYLTAPNNPCVNRGHQVGHTSYDGAYYKPTASFVDNTSAFNTTTGLFTAPVAGNYLVTFHALINTAAGSLAHAYAYFKRNDVTISGFNHTMYSITRQYEPLSLQATVRLEQNDTLGLFMHTNQGATIYQGPYSNLSISLLS